MNLDLLGRFLRLDVTAGTLALTTGVQIVEPSQSLRTYLANPTSQFVDGVETGIGISGGISAKATLFNSIEVSGSLTLTDPDVFDTHPLLRRSQAN